MTTWAKAAAWLRAALGLARSTGGRGMLVFDCDKANGDVTFDFITGNRSKAGYALLLGGPPPVATSPDQSGAWSTDRPPPGGLSDTYTLNVDTAVLGGADSPVFMVARQAGAELAELTGATRQADGYLLGTATANSQTPFDFGLGA